MQRQLGIVAIRQYSLYNTDTSRMQIDIHHKYQSIHPYLVMFTQSTHAHTYCFDRAMTLKLQMCFSNIKTQQTQIHKCKYRIMKYISLHKLF